MSWEIHKIGETPKENSAPKDDAPDIMSPHGFWEFEIRRANGSLKEKWRARNMVVNSGLDMITQKLTEDTIGAQADPKYMQLGSDNTAVTATDTTLGTVITATGMTITAGTQSQETTTITNDTMQLTHTWTNSSGGSVTVEEIAVFDGSTGSGTDDMFCHALTGSKTVANTETFQATYKCVISRAA